MRFSVFTNFTSFKLQLLVNVFVNNITICKKLMCNIYAMDIDYNNCIQIQERIILN